MEIKISVYLASTYFFVIHSTSVKMGSAIFYCLPDQELLTCLIDLNIWLHFFTADKLN